MIQGKSKYLMLPVLIVDISLLIFSVLTSSIIQNGTIFLTKNMNFLLVISIFLWVLIIFKKKLYDLPRIIYIDKVLQRYLACLTLFALYSAAIVFLFGDGFVSRFFFIVYLLIFSISIVIWHLLILKIVKRLRKKGMNSYRILLVGSNENMEKFTDRIDANKESGFRIEGLFTDADPLQLKDNYYKGKLDEIIPFCEKNHIHEMVISLPHKKGDLVNKLLGYCENNLIRVGIIPEFSEYLSQIFAIDYFENMPVMKFRREPLESLSNKFFKRGFDTLFSFLIILFVFSWLFPVIAIIIKLTSKGPIFFKQERSGKKGESFYCLKFRSMEVNNESDTLQAKKNDSRITPFGKFLREKSLDELPQFFNVLKGEMSVVGPRPHMIKHTDEYREVVDKFMIRHFAKPGITGWAQINGFRGETKYVKDMKDRAEADIWYIEKWNFLLDIKIIIITIKQVLFSKNENAF